MMLLLNFGTEFTICSKVKVSLRNAYPIVKISAFYIAFETRVISGMTFCRKNERYGNNITNESSNAERKILIFVRNAIFTQPDSLRNKIKQKFIWKFRFIVSMVYYNHVANIHIFNQTT